MTSARQQFVRGEKPFSILANQVPAERVRVLMKDEKLLAALDAAGWPTDEKPCDIIGEKQGLGAEEVAAVSKLKHALMAAEKES